MSPPHRAPMNRFSYVARKEMMNSSKCHLDWVRGTYPCYLCQDSAWKVWRAGCLVLQSSRFCEARCPHLPQTSRKSTNISKPQRQSPATGFLASEKFVRFTCFTHFPLTDMFFGQPVYGRGVLKYGLPFWGSTIKNIVFGDLSTRKNSPTEHFCDFPHS